MVLVVSKAALYVRRQVRKLGDLDKAAKATLDEARASAGRRTTCRCWCATCGTGSWPRKSRPGNRLCRRRRRRGRSAGGLRRRLRVRRRGASPCSGVPRPRPRLLRGPAPATTPNLEGGSFGVSLKRPSGPRRGPGAPRSRRQLPSGSLYRAKGGSPCRFVFACARL